MKKKSPKSARKMIALPYRVWRDLNRIRADMQKAADAKCEKYDVLCVNLSLADTVETLCDIYALTLIHKDRKGGKEDHA